MRKFGWLITVIVLVSIAGFVFSRRSSPPVVVTLAPEKKTVTRTLAVTGQVEAIRNATLSSALNGLQIKRVLVDKGNRVSAGQPVLILEDSELRAAVARAAAQVRQTEANIWRARAQLAGSEQSVLLAKETLNESLELKNQRDIAAMNVQSGQARLAQAQEALIRTREGARKQAVRAAQAQLRRAEAQLRLAEITLKREEELLRAGATAQASYDLAKTNAQNAAEAVAAAREEVQQLEEPRTEDVRQAEATVREAEAGLAGAQAILRNAERALKNRTAIRQSLTVAQTERDAGKAQMAAAQADLARAKADLAQAEAQLAKTILRAPITGVVTDRRVEPGETVVAGSPLLAFAAPSNLRIRADVDEANLKDLREGQEAVIVPDALPDLRLRGVLTEIVPSANSERGTVEVRITLNEVPDRLLPELTADVNLIIGQFENALTLPRSAILDPEGQPKVRLVVNGKVEERLVEIIAGESGQVVVKKGLTGEEKVLATPAEGKPGQTVQIKSGASGASATGS
jgi:HlyD family secretion protein